MVHASAMRERSSRNSRASALERMRHERSGVSRLDEEDEEADNVFDEVSEERYKRSEDRRKQRILSLTTRAWGTTTMAKSICSN